MKDKYKSDKMKTTTIVYLLIIVLLSSLAVILISSSEYETVQETYYISMKWKIEQLLDTDYYFEFDNTTSFLIDGEFSNPSYIYHKYEIGDIISYNTTRLVR